jgi:pimeloyl-ACP methyl ester carboxylesterase
MEQTTQHLITRADGGDLSIWTIGPDNGTPLVLCHPAPGSGLFDPDPVATAEAGIRIIAPDRQGYGASSRSASPATIAEAGRDVMAALDHFEVSRAAVAGWSAGGRVAMWVAAHHPDRIHSLAIVATPAPHEDVPWIPSEQVALIDAMRADPATAIDQMAAMFAPMVTDPSARRSFLAASPADTRAGEADPGLRARVDAMLGEAFRQGALGMAADIASYTMAGWGFDPSKIAAPTIVCSGSDDVVVPPAHGEWYTGRIPQARHVVETGAGHLVIGRVWPRIVEHLRG